LEVGAELLSAQLLRMFREVKIDPPGPGGIDRAAIFKLISFLEGIYYWYVKCVLAASDSVMSEFASGVRDGLLALDVGDGKSLSDEQCSHLLSTLRLFSHANSMESDFASSPVTELLFQFWLADYSRGDASLSDRWSEELHSTKALFAIHALEAECLALHSALATELKPKLVLHARG